VAGGSRYPDNSDTEAPGSSLCQFELGCTTLLGLSLTALPKVAGKTFTKNDWFPFSS